MENYVWAWMTFSAIPQEFKHFHTPSFTSQLGKHCNWGRSEVPDKTFHQQAIQRFKNVHNKPSLSVGLTTLYFVISSVARAHHGTYKQPCSQFYYLKKKRFSRGCNCLRKQGTFPRHMMLHSVNISRFWGTIIKISPKYSQLVQAAILILWKIQVLRWTSAPAKPHDLAVWLCSNWERTKSHSWSFGNSRTKLDHGNLSQHQITEDRAWGTEANSTEQCEATGTARWLFEWRQSQGSSTSCVKWRGRQAELRTRVSQESQSWMMRGVQVSFSVLNDERSVSKPVPHSDLIHCSPLPLPIVIVLLSSC